MKNKTACLDLWEKVFWVSYLFVSRGDNSGPVIHFWTDV